MPALAAVLALVLAFGCSRNDPKRPSAPAPSPTAAQQRLAAERVVVPEPETGPARTGYAQHLLELRRRLPPGFPVVVEPPFVVIGNGSADRVRRYAEHTIRWAVKLLKKSYFTRDPSRILDIWLLEDDTSYRQVSFELVGRLPSTPYGYYDDGKGALVMNIATGGGTLIHEIVHPFIEANFDHCPAWFNEGLGSLYEQADERDGQIVGLTNWRLRGLQDAIRRGALPSFETLTHTTDWDFYHRDPGTHYAQARYLLYYLQEMGLIVRYYRLFLEQRTFDPTGYRTLVRVLGSPDMHRFRREWEAYVLGLEFHPRT
jgi:hypothetical protein